MKKVLLSLAVAAASLTASAQTVVWSEDFEDLTTSNSKGWFSYNLEEVDPSNPVYGNFTYYDFSQAPFGTGLGSITMANEPFTITGQNPDGSFIFDWNPGTAQFGGAITNLLAPFGSQANPDAGKITFPSSAELSGQVLSLSFFTNVAPTDSPVNESEAFSFVFWAAGASSPTAIINYTPMVGGVDNASVEFTSEQITALQGQTVDFEIYAFSETGISKGALLDNLVISYDLASGVKELNNGEFSVYPNPAVNELTIANTNALAINTVNVLDITGKTVKTFNFNGSKVSQTVSIADLNTGVYFVQVNATEGTSVLRVAKK